MVASSDPQWLQGSFSTLVGLFDRVGLHNNVGKTFVMVCRPFQAAGTQSESAYGRRMRGGGPTYWERQKVRVQCRECREEMEVVSLVEHMITQYGRAAEERWIWKTSATGEEPHTYRMAFPAKGVPRTCLVDKCPGREATRTVMQVHFLHPHVLDTVVIL